MAATLAQRFKYLFTGEKALNTVNSGRGWFSVIGESFAGAWQRNVEINRDEVLSFHAVFSCLTLIAGDISKMRCIVEKQSADGIWVESSLKALDVLKRPNHFQNWMQFIENWLTSKLTRGNTYVLKIRNRKGRVVKLYIMNPDRTTVAVSDTTGQVFYTFGQDNIAGVLQGGLTVPASEVIHDRYNCLFHPLVGLPPIYASGLAATQGLKMQTNSAKFFENMSRPSGMLTAPAAISDETAARLKAAFEENYGGANIGRLAVAGDGLKYEALTLSAEESQMVEQMKLSADIVCSTFHVPKYKVMADPPSYNNIEALDQQYYSQCLQVYIEAIELCLDEGLEVPANFAITLDIDSLIRMDTKTKIESITEGIKGKLYTPNEGRKKQNLKPLKGGDTVYLQQQDFPMEVLASRASPDAKAPSPPPVDPGAVKDAEELLAAIKKEVATHANV